MMKRLMTMAALALTLGAMACTAEVEEEGGEGEVTGVQEVGGIHVEQLDVVPRLLVPEQPGQEPLRLPQERR